jgi:6-phosphogluconolactonase
MTCPCWSIGHADGTLTPMPGSPFAAGGVGIGKAIASQGALQLSSDGRYLLAVDAGSNQISVLRIKLDGSLKPVGGGPVSSNGVNPVSIAVHGDRRAPGRLAAWRCALQP